jgi:integrase
MASIQARHSRGCALGRPWTTFADATRENGCTCKPLYHVVTRDGSRLVREPVGHERKTAERRMHATETEIEEGRWDAPKTMPFNEWGDEWLKSLRKPKPDTVDGYRETVKWASKAFGSKTVRKLTPGDVSRMLALMSDGEIGGSTQAKHLRVLHACLRSAVQHGYAGRNVVDLLPSNERPRADDRESDYFDNDELQRLVPKLPAGLYRTLALVSLKTGLRPGELAALRWGDVALHEGVIHVRRRYRKGRVDEPKSRTSRRDVELQPSVVDLLGQWWDLMGKPDDDALVFPGDKGFLEPWSYGWQLKLGLRAAKVPERGPTEQHRQWYSFRHTYAKVCLESGASIFWLSRQMGHSSTNVTTKRYGHFERAASRLEAEKVTFAV